MGFANQWISLVMTCIQLVSYLILLNGEPRGLIAPSRGIRQGNPLSSYLFLLYAEGLSSLLRKVEVEKTIHGVSVCRGGPKVSHLLFADDNLIFYEATKTECERLGALFLDVYEEASGQKVNWQKMPCFLARILCLPFGWKSNSFGVLLPQLNLINIWVSQRPSAVTRG